MDTYFFCIASQTGSYGIKEHYSSSSKPNPFVLYEEVGLCCSPSEKNDEIVLSCTPEASNLALNLKLLCNMSSKLRVLPGVNPKG
jgi:hypothetical protein